MKTMFRRISELVRTKEDCPLPLGVIPDQMGINLVSVDAISWQQQDDGQLVNLTIHFLPENNNLIAK